MPRYIQRAQTKYAHKAPKHPQHSPHKHVPIKYGAKTQWVEEDLTVLLNAMQIKRVQDIVGTLLHYSRAVDPILAAVLSTIASKQTNATQETEEAYHQLLDY
eukprot:10091683-Ditylum_brightwellii.AAC.1